MTYRFAIPHKGAAAALTLGGLLVATPAFAMTGIGCPDLPEYPRAVGTIEMGEGVCNMTMEEAKRVIAREQGRAYPAQPAAAPAPRHSKKHHRRTTPPQT